MGLFNKKIGTVFLKEDSDAKVFIDKMSSLLEQADEDVKREIETQIKLASYGMNGEKNIEFELKNSGVDMYVLHDLCLEYEGMKAQIDYLIITRQRVYVIECKNLIGNIEIDSGGNFIRTYELFGKKVKEGLYSPITQNQRHLEIIRKLRKPDNIIQKHFFEKYFDDTYRSLVVLSNPKTYLNAKFAKKNIKQQVIRADALVSYLKETDKSVCCDFSNEQMLKIANLFLEYNISERSDYSLKYKEMIENLKEKATEKIEPESIRVTTGAKDENDMLCPRCGAKMVSRTAKKGENAGKEFFGCSAFPKCRYIKDKI